MCSVDCLELLQNTFLFLFNMCAECPNVGAESPVNPDAQSPWYWFSDGHALLQGILCILVCDLVAVWLFRSEKVSDLVGAVRDNYVYVTLDRLCSFYTEIQRRCCQLDPMKSLKVTIAYVEL